MAFLTSLSSPSPHADRGRCSAPPATHADVVAPETVVVGRVHVPLRTSRVSQRTTDPGVLGPVPGTHAMAGPGCDANPVQEGPLATGQAAGGLEVIHSTATPPSPIPDLDSLLHHFWEAPRVSTPRVSPSFGWWEGKVGDDHRSFAQVAASPPRARPPSSSMADRHVDFNRGHRMDGFREGRTGRGAGRFGRGAGRDRGGGGGGRNLVWTRDVDDGGQNSSNMDPRRGQPDRGRWEATAMESQSDGRRNEKWGDNNQGMVGSGNSGHRQQQQDLCQQQECRHQTPGKRNASPLVGGAEVCVTCKEPGHLPVCCPRAIVGGVVYTGILSQSTILCFLGNVWHQCVGFRLRGRDFITYMTPAPQIRTLSGIDLL